MQLTNIKKRKTKQKNTELKKILKDELLYIKNQKDKNKNICLLFDCISVFSGYLMPNQSF